MNLVNWIFLGVGLLVLLMGGVAFFHAALRMANNKSSKIIFLALGTTLFVISAVVVFGVAAPAMGYRINNPLGMRVQESFPRAAPAVNPQRPTIDAPDSRPSTGDAIEQHRKQLEQFVKP